jgi:hypothetical protein
VCLVEARGELRLTQESLAKPLVACLLRWKQLQRDATASGRVHGPVNGAHRSLTEQRLDPEAGNDRIGRDDGRHAHTNLRSAARQSQGLRRCTKPFSRVPGTVKSL